MLEQRQKELDELYVAYTQAEAIITRSGGASIALIPSVVVFLVWRDENIYILSLFFLATVIVLLLFKKYLTVYIQSKKKIRAREQEIEKEYKLRYCFCDLSSHLYCPDTERLWNHKSSILFDHHSNATYNKWHNRWHNKIGLKRGGMIISLSVLGFLLIFITIIIVSKILTMRLSRDAQKHRAP